MTPDLIPERGTIEFEAARVASAFGVEEWRVGFHASKDNFAVWQFLAEGVILHCQWCEDFWLSIRIGTHTGKERQIESHDCCSWKDYGDFQLGQPRYNELMARGFYCLGMGEAQLPALSAHEKLELRLSMPRPFWPEEWEKEVEEKSL